MKTYRCRSRGSGEENFDYHFYYKLCWRGGSATRRALKEKSACSIIRAHPGPRNNSGIAHTHWHTLLEVFLSPGSIRGGLVSWPLGAQRRILIGSFSCLSAQEKKGKLVSKSMLRRTEIAVNSTAGITVLILIWNCYFI